MHDGKYSTKKFILTRCVLLFTVLEMYEYEAILPDRLLKDVDLVAVYFGTIKNKSQTNEVLHLLKEKYPLSSLCHLKRVRCRQETDKSLEVIINRTDIILSIDELCKDETLSEYINDYRMTHVPAYQPLTRDQFKKASKFWPTSFHEDKKIKLLTSKVLFTPLQRLHHNEYMGLVNNEAGTVIVDPKLNKIICFAKDCWESEDPLLHSAMIAIDMVAFYHGGGAIKSLKYKRNANNYLVLDEVLMDEMTPATLSDGHLGAPGYLCTGYNVYMSVEPCVMCSMALLHSRVQRVFYRTRNRNNGGLGSIYKIHCDNGFNHHFDVFKIRDT